MRGQLARALRYSDGDVSKVTDDEIIGMRLLCQSCQTENIPLLGEPWEKMAMLLKGCFPFLF